MFIYMSDKYVRTGCERSVSDVIKAEIVEKGVLLAPERPVFIKLC